MHVVCASFILFFTQTVYAAVQPLLNCGRKFSEIRATRYGFFDIQILPNSISAGLRSPLVELVLPGWGGGHPLCVCGASCLDSKPSAVPACNLLFGGQAMLHQLSVAGMCIVCRELLTDKTRLRRGNHGY